MIPTTERYEYRYDTSTWLASVVSARLDATGRVDQVPRPAEFERLAEDYAAQLERLVEGVMAGHVARLIQRYRTDPDRPAERADSVEDLLDELDALVVSWTSNLAAVVQLAQQESETLVEFVTRDLGRQANEVLGVNPFAEQPELVDVVRDMVEQQSLKVDGVGKIAIREMRFAVEQAFREGWSTERLAKRLEERMGVAKSRAHFIARNEMGNLYSVVTQERQTQLGIDRYTWRTSLDVRVRPEHAAREGKVFSWDQPPEDGHPGQPFNCRCTAEPVFPDELTEEQPSVAPEQAAPVGEPGDLDGEQLMALRKELGISRAALAEEFGRSSQWLKNREAGRQQFTAEELQQLQRALVERGATPTQLQRLLRGIPVGEPEVPEGRVAGFPDSLDDLEFVQSLGGSTGAVQVRDRTTGRLFVVKDGASQEHIEEEMAADSLYRALGVRVPEFRRYKDNEGRTVKVAEFIEGRTLAAELRDASPSRRRQLLEQVQEHFVEDALLGNWDVAGLNLDNILVDADDRVWRIDNGGALRFRAMGERKGDRWGEFPMELWSLRDRNVNPSTTSVFGTMSPDQILDQWLRYRTDGTVKSKALLRALDDMDPGLAETVRGRLRHLQAMAVTAEGMGNDGFTSLYTVEQFSRHRMLLRQAGLVADMPVSLAAPERSRTSEGIIKWDTANVRDDKGIPFDLIRGGDDALSRRFSFHIGRRQSEILSRYFRQQSDNSWRGWPTRVKWWWTTKRQQLPEGRQYWWAKPGQERWFDLSSEDRAEAEEALTAQHAFTYELLNKITNPDGRPLPWKVGNKLRVLRTENREVIEDINNLKVGDVAAYDAGPMESTSLYNTVWVKAGSTGYVTRHTVPLWRCLGVYFQSRPGSQLGGLLLNDRENEALVDLNGDEPAEILAKRERRR